MCGGFLCRALNAALIRMEIIPDAPGTNTAGSTPPLQNLITLEIGIDFGRVGAHEFGHSFGLDHIKNSLGPDGKGGWNVLTTLASARVSTNRISVICTKLFE